jgi:hypothetical protein
MDSCDATAPPLRCLVVLGEMVFSQTSTTCFKVGSIRAADAHHSVFGSDESATLHDCDVKQQVQGLCQVS